MMIGEEQKANGGSMDVQPNRYGGSGKKQFVP
jgi:hypothetical protein